MICAGVAFPWHLLGIFGGAAVVLAVALFGGYLALKSANKLPSVFMPRKVQLVHYNLVHMPVKVRQGTRASQVWRQTHRQWYTCAKLSLSLFFEH